MMGRRRLDSATQNLRAKMLGDAIPAESFAAGANETDGVSQNYNMQSDMPNGWPREEFEWLHSDMKDMAYFYVFKLYEKFYEIGELK